jgi:hypothetical protein
VPARAARPAQRSARASAAAGTGGDRAPPLLPLAPQEAGLLIGRKAHGAHHRAPFEGNYCIVSGWWNELLDGSLFFR